MVKRGKLEIMKDILRIIQENKNQIKPTPLLRKSGLSSSSFGEYYPLLLYKGLILEIENKRGEKYVSLSERGLRFLDKYRAIVSFIEEFDL
jgi:predicted transcriptional regulator